MKLNFTEEEKKSIFDIIHEYEDISNNIDDLQKQSEEINNKIDNYSKRLGELSNIENDIVSKLKDKYGNFSLQDISDTLYGGK